MHAEQSSMSSRATSTARQDQRTFGLSSLRALGVAVVAAVVSVTAATGGRSSIRSEDLREWLSYIASDELEGRAVYSTGLGLAAAYIENHLRAWGAVPAGDSGSYLQTVRVLGVK